MIKIVENTKGTFHHLPDHQAPIDLSGKGIREALKEIRQMDFGNIGGMMATELSDGTFLEIDLAPAQGGGYVMDSQRCRRFEFDSFSSNEKTIRYYDI